MLEAVLTAYKNSKKKKNSGLNKIIVRLSHTQKDADEGQPEMVQQFHCQ